MNEYTKTSLLAIASIFTGIGGAVLASQPVKGTIFLLIAVFTLILRGWLKARGISAVSR